MKYAILVLGLIMSGIFIFFRKPEGGAKAVVLKALASLFFILLAVYVIGEKTSFDNAFASLMLFGMASCLAGDILLDLKVTYPQDNKIYTYSGMTAFGIGQIAYAGAAAVMFGTHWAVLLGAVGLAALTYLVTRFLFKCDYKGYHAPTLFYAIALSVSACQSLYMLIKVQNIFTVLFFIGIVMFFLSDGILCQTYFSKGKNTRFWIIANHVLYYLAQYLIAFSIAFV